MKTIIIMIMVGPIAGFSPHELEFIQTLQVAHSKM